MKNFTVMVSTLVCMLGITVAHADNHPCVFPGNIIPIAQIDKNAQDLGYEPVSKIFSKKVKLKECIYSIDVKDKADQDWQLFFNPNDGKLIAKRQN